MSLQALSFPAVDLPPATQALRAEVRAFLEEEREAGRFVPHCDAWVSHPSPEFSRTLGQRGWLGMMWPKAYGGHERSVLDRFVVSEEVVAAGAPVSAHWIADRQSAPLILRYATEEQKKSILPAIARGECYFAIGMSEPNAGSDLAGVKTRMERAGGGWVLNGAKVWSTGAHLCHYMIVLCRTSEPGEKDRHKGLSQVLVDLHRKGVTIRPIHVLSGAHHFNEVVFENVEIADDEILGTEGQGWKQVTEELAYERSGPERYLSTFPLIVELARRLERERTPHQAMLFGRLLAQFWTLRNMSLRVNGLLAAGRMPNVEASVVKDLGTRFERDSVDVVRAILPAIPSLESPDPFLARFAEAVLYSPSFTLRGGTNEILRGIIARGLGLR